MSYENYSERPVGYSGSEKPVGHDYVVGEFYDRQYAAANVAPSKSSGASRGGLRSSSSKQDWTFSWLFAIIGAFRAFAIASANQAPSPFAAAMMVGFLAGSLHQLIKFLFGLAIIGFIAMVIAKALYG